jgi:hypothetical protein
VTLLIGALTGTGRDALSGGEIVVFLLLIPFLFWVLKKADRVMGFNGDR